MNAKRFFLALLALGLVAPGLAGAQDGFIAPPTPCELDPSQSECREPVIIIPGIVASHNRQCILQDRCAPGVGDWGYTPTAGRWYQPLIDRLEEEGYEEGTDIFVVFYDWRQTNLESMVEYLLPIIDEALSSSDAAEVDIVAHSMGGLVARAYAQSDTQYQDDIDDLILVGTPNLGAADAYAVLEGGDLPERWGFATQQWINRIERVVKKKRDIRDLRRPESIRSIFVSLKDLLPINDFVTRGGTPVAVADLNDDAQNSFLAGLEATKDRLGAAGISVTTIAGTDRATLAMVPVGEVAERSQADVDLARWRDGPARPDPPVADSTAGDQTVLASSVHALGGRQHDLSDTLHEELVAEAQEEIVAALIDGDTIKADFIPSRFASAALGVDLLSPALPVLTGPGGETLSVAADTFPESIFDWDPADPDAPKLLTVIDPPAGQYTLSVTGNGPGDYDLAVSHANNQQLLAEEAAAPTTANEEHIYTFTVGGEALNLVRVGVPVNGTPAELLQRIIDRAYEEQAAGLLRGYERANLTRPAKKALRRLDRYLYHLERGRDRSAQSKLRSFYKQLAALERDLERKLAPRDEATAFVDEIRSLLEQIHLGSPPLAGHES